MIFGNTGNGKSTLVNCLTGNEDAAVGEDARGVTKSPAFYQARIDEKDFEIIDLPGFGDRDISIKKSLELWDKYIKGKKIHALIFTHKSSDDRLTIFDSAYADIVKQSFEPHEYSSRIAMGITFWNHYENDSKRKDSKINHFTTNLLEELNKSLGFNEAENQIKMTLFFTDRNEQCQSEIQKIARLFDEQPQDVKPACKVDDVATILSKHLELDKVVVKQIVKSNGTAQHLQQAEKNDCFPPHAKIRLEDGSEVQVKDLKIGDRILSYNVNKKQQFVDVITNFLHKELHESCKYLRITLQNDRILEISQNHMVCAATNDFIGKSKYIQALKLKKEKHKMIIIGENGVYHLAEIKNIEEVSYSGKYAPLTRSGSIIVNDVVASCYAGSFSQKISHIAILPIQIWYKNQDLKGIHPYANVLSKIFNN
ncbi:indian hedgehog protein [Stylonychia lemnae]|uniref:Indian hedgehog protein n=1 Tax=Stylonychia lemnae TaxID=5949 RepID=A0A078AGG1_STYLE|nr:indian hedgehog protein [Stylonychia lemnae]|eukprot:CDW79933.1 indian hedgehog protein [Stylonychia lemnae]